MPKLLQPELVAKMTGIVSDVMQTRSILQSLGDQPDHEAVDEACRRVAEIERNLSSRLEEISMEEPPEGYDRGAWLSLQAQKEKDARKAADKEKFPFKSVVHLYEMHVAYEDLLQEAEERLTNIYREAENGEETPWALFRVHHMKCARPGEFHCPVLHENWVSAPTNRHCHMKKRIYRLVPQRCGQICADSNSSTAFDKEAYEAERLRLDADAREAMMARAEAESQQTNTNGKDGNEFGIS